MPRQMKESLQKQKKRTMLRFRFRFPPLGDKVKANANYMLCPMGSLQLSFSKREGHGSLIG